MTDHDCAHCAYYKEYEGGIFGGDGLCHVVRKKPKAVRRWFRNCPQFTHKTNERN